MTGRRHARQAALPPAGFVRDLQPVPGSLAVTVAGESGGTEAPQAPEDVTPAVWAQWRLSRPGTVYGRACQLAVRQWLPQVAGIPAATICGISPAHPGRPRLPGG